MKYQVISYLDAEKILAEVGEDFGLKKTLAKLRKLM